MIEILLYCPNCGWRFKMADPSKGECPACFVSLELSHEENGKYILKVK